MSQVFSIFTMITNAFKYVLHIIMAILQPIYVPLAIRGVTCVLELAMVLVPPAKWIPVISITSLFMEPLSALTSVSMAHTPM